MRVAHYYADLLQGGGLPDDAHLLAAEQVSKGHTVLGYCLGRKNDLEAPDGVTFRIGSRSLSGLGFVMRMLRKDHPDIVHVWGALLPSNSWILRTAKRAKIATMLSPQGHLAPFLYRGPSALHKKAFRSFSIKPSLARHVDAFHALSPHEEMLARGLGFQRQIAIFSLGVPDRIPPSSRPGPIRTTLGIGEEDIVAGYFGRLEPVQKGLDILISALSQSATMKSSKVTFVLSGRGSDRELSALRGLLSSAGLMDRVPILGPFPPEDRFAVLRDLDLLVHPSRYEGIPRVIREAAALGLPAIVSEDTNAHGLVAGAAAVFTELDPSPIARAIDRVLEDEDWRRTASGRALDWAGHNDWSSVANNFLNLYEIAIRSAVQARTH